MPRLDLDEIVYVIFRKTLFFWLFPYILWFFAKKITRAVSHWLTEPPRDAA